MNFYVVELLQEKEPETVNTPWDVDNLSDSYDRTLILVSNPVDSNDALVKAVRYAERKIYSASITPLYQFMKHNNSETVQFEIILS